MARGALLLVGLFSISCLLVEGRGRERRYRAAGVPTGGAATSGGTSGAEHAGCPEEPSGPPPSASGADLGAPGGDARAEDAAPAAASTEPVVKTAPPEPPPPSGCGDRDAYAACHWAQGAEQCSAAGGSRLLVGTSEICQCPAGDAGCPCRSAAGCAGDCLALGTPDADNRCEPAAEGTCSKFRYVSGCACRFDAGGKVISTCP